MQDLYKQWLNDSRSVKFTLPGEMVKTREPPPSNTPSNTGRVYYRLFNNSPGLAEFFYFSILDWISAGTMINIERRRFAFATDYDRHVLIKTS